MKHTDNSCLNFLLIKSISLSIIYYSHSSITVELLGHVVMGEFPFFTRENYAFIGSVLLCIPQYDCAINV